MPSKSVLVVFILALALVSVSGASPPPEPLCGVCTDRLTESATDHGVGLATGDSRLSIHVFENGSSRWRARVEVQTGASTLGTNDSLRQAIVSDAQFRHVGDPTGVTSRVINGSLVVTYRESNVTHRSSGVLMFDVLSESNTPALLYAGADTAVLHAPDGYRVANQPAGNVTTNATAVTWGHGNPPGKHVDVEHTSVAFAPTGTFAAGLRGQFAIALAVGPTLVLGSVLLSILPGATLGGAGAFLVRRTDTTGHSDERISLLAFFVAIVLAAAVVFGGGTFSVPQRAVLSFVVLAALFFGLGYRRRADRRAWGLVGALALAPFATVLGGMVVGQNGLAFVRVIWGSVFAVAGVVGVPVGVGAFFLGRRANRTAI